MAAAARAPGAVAVISDAGQMTYSELANEARGLAARLRATGVSVESRVAVVMDRSPGLAVALLGVLEAGGVYLPLDADASQESMLFILSDANVACILTNKALRRRVPDTGVPIVVVDERPQLETKVSPEPSVSHARRAAGANLCCALYTPGGAGEPKGVAAPHLAIMNLLRSLTREIEVTPADTMLAIAPMTFDLSILELLLPLVNGARVAIAPCYAAANGADLQSRVERDRVTIIQATPAIWRLMLDSGWQATTGVRLLCGAEPPPRELARELIATAGRFWNCYGFTETTIYSAFERITCPDEAVTIGRPIANTSIYVLDRRQRPVPIGALGEIYIGGAGLAREYIGRAALTAEGFCPDPFNSRPGSRMRASGDRGRYRPDGRIERHGRRDQQVKINGWRIDLEAVSEALDTHPLIRCSVVVCRTEADGPCLVAYAASAAPEGLAKGDLWEHLTQRLPSYMLPSAIVLLDGLPLTGHGRVDRNALPAPDASDFRYAPTLVEPRTPSEEAVAAVWRETLGRQAISVEDDFFALGGNSLQVARALQMIRATCGMKCSFQMFFEEPTIAALARHVDRARASSPSATQLTVTPIPRDGDLELAPQQENWWYNEFLTGQVHPNNLHFGIRLTGSLRPAAVEQSVAMLQRRHEALRTAFAPRDRGGAAVLITPPDACELQVVHLDLSHLAPELRPGALRLVSQHENGRPFDLTRGNLCRVILARLDAEDHVVLLTIHHLVFDEWSMGIFLKDISTLYASAAGGVPSPLRPLEFQYVDFARWQRDWLSSPAAAEQFSFWRRQLAPPLPPLLPEGDDEYLLNGSGLMIRGRAPFVIGLSAAEPARRLARSEKCTLFSVFMAVIKTVLYAHARQPDLRIGTLVANRSLPGAERMIGLFLNAVCLRTRIDPARPFNELVREAHATIADATANQDLPYEIMAGDLEITQQAQRERLLQAMAVWRAMPSPETLRFPAITPSSYQVDDDTTESLVFARNAIDLRFELVETPTVITGNITYNLSRFTASDIREMANAMEKCLTLVNLDPKASVARLCESLPSRAAAPAGPRAEAGHI
jgi:amino acid adenylation domain-containing protein